MNELKTNRWNDYGDEEREKPPNKWIEYKMRLCVRIRAQVKCSKLCVSTQIVFGFAKKN